MLNEPVICFSLKMSSGSKQGMFWIILLYFYMTSMQASRINKYEMYFHIFWITIKIYYLFSCPYIIISVTFTCGFICKSAHEDLFYNMQVWMWFIIYIVPFYLFLPFPHFCCRWYLNPLAKSHGKTRAVHAKQNFDIFFLRKNCILVVFCWQ